MLTIESGIRARRALQELWVFTRNPITNNRTECLAIAIELAEFVASIRVLVVTVEVAQKPYM